MNDHLKTAIHAAVLAGKKVLEYYQTTLEVTIKEDGSELTKADIASNTIITSTLEKFGMPIISEETTNHNITNETTWVIDPLDGTKGFIKHSGDFSIMIGMLKDKKPYLGVVYEPVSNTLYYAEKRKGAWIETQQEKRKLQVQHTDKLNHMRIIISKEHFIDKDATFAKLIGADDFVRRGSIGIKLGQIAAGHADLYYNFDGLSIWDICAAEIILEEAGGEVFDLNNRPLIYENKRFRNGIIASNGSCRKELMDAVAKLKE